MYTTNGSSRMIEFNLAFKCDYIAISHCLVKSTSRRVSVCSRERVRYPDAPALRQGKILAKWSRLVGAGLGAEVAQRFSGR